VLTALRRIERYRARFTLGGLERNPVRSDLALQVRFAPLQDLHRRPEQRLDRADRLVRTRRDPFALRHEICLVPRGLRKIRVGERVRLRVGHAHRSQRRLHRRQRFRFALHKLARFGCGGHSFTRPR
jgi:hypothetical protein